ncbi:MFS transporter [Cnuibacter physcomitrellae]|uniref:MFS transporter n=1 Tax=Cnuibacter physcomitrellae TaxID=1619308 RepID=UPI0021757F30|nr:MFS transporter [Cnuibacter physcomitrellae]MCS5498247.1 MFS transporter [Cnuibacter physcomitrellae]
MTDLPTGSLPLTVGPGGERLWTRRFVLLLISAVGMYLTTFMLTPTLPLYAEDLGGDAAALGGLIVALYTLGALLPRLLWGRWADAWGRRRVYLIGVVIMTILSPLYPVFAVLPAVFAVRLLQGVGFSAASTAAATMAADLVPSSRRAEGIGYYALANTLGMALGPNLGLALYQDAGARWLFAASAAAGLLALAVGIAVNYERTLRRRGRPARSAEPPERSVAQPSARTPVVESSVLPVCVVFLFVVMPYGATMALIAVYGLERGVEAIGAFFTVFAVALLVVRVGVGRLADRFGATAAFVPSIVFMVAGLVVLGEADDLWVFLLSALLFGLGYGVAVPLLQSLVYRFAPPARRGAASATFLATADIAYGGGALVLGLSASLIGYAVSFVGLSVLLLVALVLYLALIRPRLQRRDA